jgi:hypothetical protein
MSVITGEETGEEKERNRSRKEMEGEDRCARCMEKYNLRTKLLQVEFKLEFKFEIRIERNKKKRNRTVHFGPTNFTSRASLHSLRTAQSLFSRARAA